jgi:hypothetical protein
MVTEYPLSDILQNKEASGCIIKWVVELEAYTIEYKARNTIKSQALTNFIAKWMDMQTPVSDDHLEHCTMYFDGSLNIDGAGAGVYIISPSGDKLRYIFRIRASNNTPEYKVALHGLHIAVELGVKRL